MQSYLLLILAFCGYPIYPKEKKIRKFEFWARSGWSQNVRQIILVRELTCRAFYTWASDWDIWGKPIPRYDTNTLIVFYCIVSYRIVSYRVVSCRVVSCRIVSYRIVSCRVVSCRIVLYPWTPPGKERCVTEGVLRPCCKRDKRRAPPLKKNI